MLNSFCLVWWLCWGPLPSGQRRSHAGGTQGLYFAIHGVTTTRPFNQHFVCDIGLIFLFLGGAFLRGAAPPQLRVLHWAAPSRRADSRIS